LLTGVIVTHAGLAAALRVAAAQIAGDVTGVDVVSNDGLSAEDLLVQVRAALERASGDGNDGSIVFTDMGGGSCATACQSVLADFPGTRLVTGVNLPMLVDFVLRRADLDTDAMVQRLLQRGVSSIQEIR
jgi:mannose/fructose-specific phosphotransferase system component IIA